MRIVILPNESQVGVEAAQIVASYVRSAPRPAIGLATGSTMNPVLDCLASIYANGAVCFDSVELFLLDEYVGLDRSHPRAYINEIRCFADRIGVPEDRVHGPPVWDRDLNEAATRYDKAVVRAQIGVQLLGIGENGHLAFNEPGSPHDSTTRLVRLSVSTLEANSRFFDSNEATPRTAITQGLSTITRAKHLVLVATGSHKAPAVADAITGEVTTAVPASIIRRHPQTTVVLDYPASSALDLTRLAAIREAEAITVDPGTNDGFNRAR